MLREWIGERLGKDSALRGADGVDWTKVFTVDVLITLVCVGALAIPT